MFHIFNINEHLDSNEKLIEFFRPSRLAYFFHYIIHILILILAIIFTLYDGSSSNLFIFWKYLNYIAEIMLVYSVIMLVRLEYRIWSRRYALTDERVLYSKGILSEKFMSSPHTKVTDIGFHQSFLDKIFNTGTLKINTAGTDGYEIRYRKIRDPLKIKKMINDRQTINTTTK